jgi:Zn-finger nucleic acid-binding protein
MFAVSESVEPRCPRCGDALRRVEQADVVVWVCGRAEGVWLDNDVGQRLVRAELPRRVLAALGERDATPAVELHARLSCPFCRAPLTRTGVPAAHVDVDVCAAHGTWFDRGELERVLVGFEKAKRDREEIRQLLEQPGENVYLRGLKRMPVAAVEQLQETAQALSELELHDDDERREHHEPETSWLDVLGAAGKLLRDTFRR